MPVKKGNMVETGEQRGYFRVDDVISVIANPVEINKEKNDEFLKSLRSSKAFSLMDVQMEPEHIHEDGSSEHDENSKLYAMVTEIKTKLDFIINHFILDREGMLSPEKKLVNISASGIRFTVNHPVCFKDVMEIKLLLPTYPPVAVCAYGEVKRVTALDDGKYEVALEYLNMEDSVRNEIIQYTMTHQRETIRKLRENGSNE